MTRAAIAEAASTLRLEDPSLLREACFINGEWCGADEGGVIPVTNPANGDVIAHVPKMGADETARAIDAANAAWPEWRNMLAKERSAILRRWHDLMLENADDLAIIMTAEQGKPLEEARGEIAYAASFLEWFAEEAKRVYGETIPATAPDRRFIVIRQPIGVCAAITPWNFPAAMITRKAGPALAAGCPMVVKPATATPLSALALGVLAERAGVPSGVLSIVTGPAGAVGKALTDSPVVRKLSFTGSTSVGKRLMADCAGTVKKLSLELGGNAPFIVFDDADLDAAVEGAIQSKFRNSGQTCVCANRILVQAGVYDAFAEKFSAAVGDIKLGDGLSEGVQQGPMIDDDAGASVEAHIADALAKGASAMTGGARLSRGSLFMQPTVLTGITPEMAVMREEIFGPVAPLAKFATEEEAIRIANDTEYGLAAYFYARDMGRIMRVGEALEFGMVGVNAGIISTEAAPFGGVKESGFGREGSRHGIEEYLEMKYLSIAGISS